MTRTRPRLRRALSLITAAVLAGGLSLSATPALAANDDLSFTTTIDTGYAANQNATRYTFTDNYVSVTLTTPTTGNAAPGPADMTLTITNTATGDASLPLPVTFDAAGSFHASVKLPATWITNTTMNFTATVRTDGGLFSTVPFSILAYSTPTNLSVSAPTTATAYSLAAVTATVTAASGTPIAGTTVSLTSGLTTVASGTTDATGVVTMTFTTGTAGRALFGTVIPTTYGIVADALYGPFGPIAETSRTTKQIQISPRQVTLRPTVPASGALGSAQSVSVAISPNLPAQAAGDSIQILRGTTVVASAPTTGQNSVSIPVTDSGVPGTETLTVRYVTKTSPASITASDAPVSLTWVPTPTSTTIDIAPAAPTGLDPLTVTSAALVGSAAAPDGIVEFTLLDANGDSIGDPISADAFDGAATATFPAQVPGDYRVTAAYTPADGTFATSSGTAEVSVEPITTTVGGALSATTATVGDAVTFHVAVTPAEANIQSTDQPTIAAGRAAVLAAPRDAVPTGRVVLIVNGSEVGDPVALAAGTATLTVPTSAAGTYAVTARYLPDAAFIAGDSPTPAPLVVTAKVVAATPSDPTSPLASTGADLPLGLLVTGIIVLAAGAVLRRRLS